MWKETQSGNREKEADLFPQTTTRGSAGLDGFDVSSIENLTEMGAGNGHTSGTGGEVERPGRERGRRRLDEEEEEAPRSAVASSVDIFMLAY